MASPNDQKRREKIERRKKERSEQEALKAQSSFRNRLLMIGGSAVLIVGLIVAWNSGLFGGSADDHPYGEFAQCLTDNDVTMYGTDWCPNCQEQKRMFEVAFNNIDYVNCDFNTQVCRNQKIEGYPTWKKDLTLIGAGVQTFKTLGEAAGCELPEVLK